MSHRLDIRTLVCSCGRTKEQHTDIEIANEGVKARWASGEVNLGKDFAELDKALNAHKEVSHAKEDN